MDEIFLAFLMKTLGMTREQVLALVKNADGTIIEDAANALLERDKERIKDIKTSSNTDGYNKAKKEVLGTLEKEIREKYGIETDKKGIELVNEIVEKKATSNNGTPAEEVVKKHPAYIALENKIATQKTDLEKDFNTKFAEKENEWKREKTLGTVKTKGLSLFDALKPILSTDPAKAENQRKIILRELEKFDYEENGDDFTVLKKDGSRLEDAHGNLVKFKDLIKNTSEQYFDFQVADDRSSSGNKGGGTGGDATKKFKGEFPKTSDDYENLISDRSIPLDQRMEVTTEWEAQQAGK